MSEETRAAEYRRKMTARARWEATSAASLAADPAAAATVRAAWEPVTNPVRTWDPPCPTVTIQHA